MILTRVMGVCLVLHLLVAAPPEAQQYGAITKAGRDRASLAETFEQSFHEEGCTDCRVWVSGLDNTTVEILDPQATRTANDYNGTPVFWYDAGFTKVTYYSAPGVVYAQHELPSFEPPPTLPEQIPDEIPPTPVEPSDTASFTMDLGQFASSGGLVFVFTFLVGLLELGCGIGCGAALLLIGAAGIGTQYPDLTTGHWLGSISGLALGAIGAREVRRWWRRRTDAAA